MELLVRNVLWGDELSRIVCYTQLKNSGLEDSDIIKYGISKGYIKEVKRESKNKKARRKSRSSKVR